MEEAEEDEDDREEEERDDEDDEEEEEEEDRNWEAWLTILVHTSCTKHFENWSTKRKRRKI